MNNKLNDLTGKEWVQHTKSWFILRGKQRKSEVINHPAKYPEELATKFIEFFTKKNQLVFDPFMGVGSTAVAAESIERQAKGIELNSDFFQIAVERAPKSQIIHGDSREKSSYQVDDGTVDFIINSPPYWNMLKKKRGHSASQHQQREDKNLQLYYSDSSKDLGNLEDYDEFLQELKKVYLNCSTIIKKNGYMVVVAQNFRNSDGQYITYAWDLVNIIKECGFTFEGDHIWCQDDKQLGIWGYPSKFILNVHHHYCLVFKKNA